MNFTITTGDTGMIALYAFFVAFFTSVLVSVLAGRNE